MSIAVALPVPLMADEDSHVGIYKAPSPPLVAWTAGQSPHRYPHSHHGTPAQEYSGFVFNSPPLPMDASGGFLTHPHTRPYHHQLQPLVMPQWPSMLNSHQSMPQSYPPVYGAPIHPMPSAMSSIPTPVSTTSTKSGSNPRRTLTDSDRKDMCLYAENNPDKKQTEIGAVFGVERSTVSKVLRQKEKYLFQDDGSRSPIKRLKGRSPDIERALAVWAKNQERKGIALTNDMIRERARAFLATTSNADSHPALSHNWIEKFKMKNALAGAKSRKSSISPEDAEEISTLRTPAGASPRSTSDLSPPALHSSNSLESLTDGSGDDNYIDLAHVPSHSQSMGSLHAAFHAGAATAAFSSMSPTSSLFSPDAGTAPAQFVPHLHSSNLQSPDLDEDCSQRPRRQTFPLIHPVPPHTMAPKYTLDALDSPMQEHPSQSMDPTILSVSGLPQHTYQHGSTTHDRPRSITPTNAMAPPPLPTQFGTTAAPTGVDIALEQPPPEPIHHSRHISSQPTAEDARRAMETLYEYIQQQGGGFLELEEGICLGRLMEKVQRQSGTAMHP